MIMKFLINADFCLTQSIASTARDSPYFGASCWRHVPGLWLQSALAFGRCRRLSHVSLSGACRRTCTLGPSPPRSFGNAVVYTMNSSLLHVQSIAASSHDEWDGQIPAHCG